jgi:hypothetical protein
MKSNKLNGISCFLVGGSKNMKYKLIKKNFSPAWKIVSKLLSDRKVYTIQEIVNALIKQGYAASIPLVRLGITQFNQMPFDDRIKTLPMSKRGCYCGGYFLQSKLDFMSVD